MRHSLLCLLALLPACGGGGGGSASPAPTVVTVGFASASALFQEGDLGAPVLLTLSGPASGPVTVPVVIGSSSSASMGSDFVLVDTEAVFPAGQTTATVRVDFVDDGECEGDELLRLLLGAPTGDVQLGPQDTFDAVIDGTVVDVEPNDSAFDAVGNGAVGSLMPGTALAICAEVQRQPGPDNTDAFLFEADADVTVQVQVSTPQSGADLILIVSELDSSPVLVVDLVGNGGTEVANFQRASGEDFVVAVSTTNAPGPGWTQAPLDVSVSATLLLPPALTADDGWPQPEPDPVLAELVDRGATWDEILAARRHD